MVITAENKRKIKSLRGASILPVICVAPMSVVFMEDCRFFCR